MRVKGKRQLVIIEVQKLGNNYLIVEAESIREVLKSILQKKMTLKNSKMNKFHNKIKIQKILKVEIKIQILFKILKITSTSNL